MDKNIAVMVVLITAWAVTAMGYPYKEKGGKPAGSSILSKMLLNLDLPLSNFIVLDKTKQEGGKAK